MRGPADPIFGAKVSRAPSCVKSEGTDCRFSRRFAPLASLQRRERHWFHAELSRRPIEIGDESPRRAVTSGVCSDRAATGGRTAPNHRLVYRTASVGSGLGNNCVSARGLHHVTAIIGDVRRSADFYAGVLGLKRVQKTVCYDDPGSYHVYYGDEIGNPGAVISTLAWNCVTPGLSAGRRSRADGLPRRIRVARSMDGSAQLLGGDSNRLDVSPFGERMLCFIDPDGTALSLVEGWETQPEKPAETSQSLVRKAVCMASR